MVFKISGVEQMQAGHPVMRGQRLRRRGTTLARQGEKPGRGSVYQGSWITLTAIVTDSALLIRRWICN